MARRDQRIDQLQNELQMQIQEKESITRALKQQIAELHDRLRVVGEHGVREITPDSEFTETYEDLLNKSEIRQNLFRIMKTE